jgi:hypothetical protein
MMEALKGSHGIYRGQREGAHPTERSRGNQTTSKRTDAGAGGQDNDGKKEARAFPPAIAPTAEKV